MNQGEPVQRPESLSRDGAVALAIDFCLAWNMGLQFPPSHKLACASSLVGELPLPLRMPPFFLAE